MKQVVQSVRDGRLRVVDLPRPSIGPTEVLVAPTHSVVSAGTERAVRELASSANTAAFLRPASMTRLRNVRYASAMSWLCGRSRSEASS